MQGRTMFRGNGEHRRPVHNAGVALDITERHRFEDELNDARHAAEAANEAKSQFLANMSHEIRTPLTAILGFADVLHTRVQDPEDLASINTIKENGDHLCQILNDILDLAKIESGKMVARNEDCDIVSILTHMRSLMAVRATNKGLTLTIELNGDIPCTIQSDAKMLRQILLNLVGNAIKFTETGGIRLAVSCLREEQLLEIAVIDSGVGIEQEKLDVLFLPFEQVDNSATRVAEGTGLGLAISKHLAELLGAQMRVESALNKGSTFRLSIPTGSLDGVKLISDLSMDLAEQETGTLADQLPEISGRVLTVDDRREIRFLIEKLLESTGVDIVTASDGAQGLESWRENNQAGTPFDAILMDMQMPVMDGLEATRKLREQGYEGPVIALTANAMSTDRAKALQAGCNDFITKPIDRSQLIDKLYKWIDQAAGKSPPPPAL
jgi:CheY-like chemotaxis protein